MGARRRPSASRRATQFPRRVGGLRPAASRLALRTPTGPPLPAGFSDARAPPARVEITTPHPPRWTPRTAASDPRPPRRHRRGRPRPFPSRGRPAAPAPAPAFDAESPRRRTPTSRAPASPRPKLTNTPRTLSPQKTHRRPSEGGVSSSAVRKDARSVFPARHKVHPPPQSPRPLRTSARGDPTAAAARPQARTSPPPLPHSGLASNRLPAKQKPSPAADYPRSADGTGQGRVPLAASSPSPASSEF